MARRASLTGSLTGDETAFGKRICDLARRAGWIENHTYRSRINGAWRTTTTGIGFPDHVFLKAGRLVVLELKMPGNEATPEQARWIELFATVPGCDARIVYPADWPWIVSTLTQPRSVNPAIVGPEPLPEGTTHD